MFEFETFFAVKQNGFLFVPGAPNLNEFHNKSAYVTVNRGTGFDFATLNFNDCGFVLEPVNEEEHKYRIHLKSHPDIYLSRVCMGNTDASLQEIMATKIVRDTGIFTIEVQDDETYRRYGRIRLKSDLGTWVCFNESNGHLVAINDIPNILELAPIHIVY